MVAGAIVLDPNTMLSTASMMRLAMPSKTPSFRRERLESATTEGGRDTVNDLICTVVVDAERVVTEGVDSL